ncbi:MAG: ATP-dependent helicase, partial [Chitinophagaceae bacterium]
MAGKTIKGLLFNPQKFEQLNECWQIIIVEKTGDTIKQQTERLSNKSLNLHFPLLPNNVKEALLKFTEPQINLYFQKLNGLLSETDKEKGLAEKNLFKEWHQQLIFLTSNTLKIPFYQYFQTSAKSARIEPISFSNEKPKLTFSITKKNHLFQLSPAVLSGNNTITISDCYEAAFLLSNNRIYHILKWIDYQQLIWLKSIEKKLEFVSEENFRQQVLARFEKDYTINRNGFFEPITINDNPQCRVLLSELNNAFLMLTPQFLYDGLLVEGSFTATTIIKKNGQLYHVNRQKEAENHFIELIVKLHPNFAKQYNGYYYLSFAEAQKKHWFLITYQRLLEQNIEVTGVDLLQHFRYSPHNISTTIIQSTTIDQWVCLQLTVAFGDEKLSLFQLQKAVWNNQKAVVLKNGSLGILSEEWLQQYGLLIKHGNVKQNELWVAGWMAMHVHQLPVYNEANLQKQIPENWWQLWQQWQATETSNFTIPTIVQATLRPYQQKGFEWMILLSQIQAGALLADD